MDDIERHNLLVSIINNSTILSFIDPLSFYAEIKLTPCTIEDIKSAVTHDLILIISINDTTHNLEFDDLYNYQGSLLKYKIGLPTPNEDFAIVRSFDDLLTIPIFYTQCPHSYYSIKEHTNILPSSYIDTTIFCNLLIQISDHVEYNGGINKCFIYSGVKISILIQYSTNDIQGLSGVKNLASSYEAHPHIDERVKILKEIIVQYSLGESENVILSSLLKKFDSIKQRFEQNWYLFISEFSISKIVDELETKILNIADRLTNSLSELQKTMITIPLAIIFVAPQFSDILSSQYKNFLLLISLWIFLLFTLIFFWAHKRNLKFIENELDSIIIQTEEKYPHLSDKVVNVFTSLKKINVNSKVCIESLSVHQCGLQF